MRIKKASMTPFHYLIAGMCFVALLSDGYDLMIIGFTLPHLPEHFADNAEKGLLVSAGLIGMGVGAAFLGTAADRFGRKRMLLLGLALNAFGPVLTAMSKNFETFLISRVITGVGVGVVTVLAIVIIQEFTPETRRNFNVGLVGLGFPIGAFLSGAISIPIIDQFGSWRALYVAGASLAVVGLLAVAAFLPESPEFVLRNRAENGETEIGRTLRKLKIDSSDLSIPNGTTAMSKLDTPRGRPDGGIRKLLATEFRERTVLLWVMYSGQTVALYFVGSWTPQLIASESGDKNLGTLIGTIFGFGGILGSLLFILIGLRLAASRIVGTFYVLGAGLMLAFALQMGVVAAAIVSALALGLAIYTASAAVSGMTPPLYPVELRASGYGTMLGVARIFAIVSPIMVGIAIQHLSVKTMYLLGIVPLAIAAVAAIRLHKISRRLLAPRDPGVLH